MLIALSVLLSAHLSPVSPYLQLGPVKVELRQQGGKWQLLRGGKPYFVKGVGGTERMDELKAMGGNSMRTWGADNMMATLDEAHRRGMTVTVGIWLGHTAHGFRWNNPTQINEQREAVRKHVMAYRNHPALLFWALGNEMEVNNNDNETLWREINELAKIVKQLDPNRPVMTVVAETDKAKAERIRTFAPMIDILGVNSYGGLNSLPNRLREFGWTKPYVVTEFGPLGPWERPRTSWGAALEQTSTEKAAFYAQNYERSVSGQPGFCLGSYAFLWGWKQEATPTWFGMWLYSGERTESVDEISRMWTGRYPENRTPQIKGLTFSGAQKEVRPGDRLSVAVDAADPNGDALRFTYKLRREIDKEGYAGEGEKKPELVEGVVNRLSSAKGEFNAPTEPGAYRLYIYVSDGRGTAGMVNSPFRVVR